MKEFDERIYIIAAMIPEGKVASYGQLAAMAGYPRTARAAGRAMKNAPSSLGIPCHRVVNKKGEMAPGQVFGGESHQRELLEEEGVRFNANGKIDMKKYQWEPE